MSNTPFPDFPLFPPLKQKRRTDSAKASQIFDFWRKNILGEPKDLVGFYKIVIEIAEGSQQVNFSGSRALTNIKKEG